MHNPSSCTSQCPSAVLSVSLVPIVCTPPSVAKHLRSSSAHPPVPYGSPGVLCLRGSAVFVLVSYGQLCPVVCASVPQCGLWRSG